MHSNIFELLRIFIYRFDKFDQIKTESHLYKDHIDEKNDPKHPRVVVFSTLIWHSDWSIGIKGWWVAIIYYIGKSIGGYYHHLKSTCSPTVSHSLNVFSTFPAWKILCLYYVTIWNQYCKKLNYTKTSNLEVNTIAIRDLNIIWIHWRIST